RVLRLSLRSRNTRDSGLYCSGCCSRLAGEAHPQYFSNATRSQTLLEDSRPSRIFCPGNILLPLHQRTHPTCCWDDDRWSNPRPRLSETADTLGEERIQRPPKARPDGRLIGLFRSLLRLHPRIVRATWDKRPRGRLHPLPPLDTEEDHPAIPTEQILSSTWVPNAGTDRPRRNIAGYEKPRSDSQPSFCNFSFPVTILFH